MFGYQIDALGRASRFVEFSKSYGVMEQECVMELWNRTVYIDLYGKRKHLETK